MMTERWPWKEHVNWRKRERERKSSKMAASLPLSQRASSFTFSFSSMSVAVATAGASLPSCWDEIYRQAFHIMYSKYKYRVRLTPSAAEESWENRFHLVLIKWKTLAEKRERERQIGRREKIGRGDWCVHQSQSDFQQQSEDDCRRATRWRRRRRRDHVTRLRRQREIVRCRSIPKRRKNKERKERKRSFSLQQSILCLIFREGTKGAVNDSALARRLHLCSTTQTSSARQKDDQLGLSTLCFRLLLFSTTQPTIGPCSFGCCPSKRTTNTAILCSSLHCLSCQSVSFYSKRPKNKRWYKTVIVANKKKKNLSRTRKCRRIERPQFDSTGLHNSGFFDAYHDDNTHAFALPDSLLQSSVSNSRSSSLASFVVARKNPLLVSTTKDERRKLILPR